MIPLRLQAFQASARKALSAYDAYLRREAERRGLRSRFPSQAVFAPWGGSALFLVVCFRAFGGPLWLFLLVLLLAALLFLVGFWAMGRVIRYSWAFERTPPAAPWTQTDAGQALIRALGRVTLNSLTAVTPQARLRDDLKLTGGDISELLSILRQEGWLDEADLQPPGSGGLTVGKLLGAMGVGDEADRPQVT